MADVRPFRALRYDEEAAGPLERLVAPPYDVISPAQRTDLRGRSPHNIVHLTLPDSEGEAATTLTDWRERRVLVEDAEPAVYVVEQSFTGPDGVARTRTGLVASVRAEPYERGTILPHERTHAGPKEGRLRLLRAVRTQLEPIFLLHDGPAPVRRPDRPADLEVEDTRMWRVEDEGAVAAAFTEQQLLIADGHHRYETSLAFHAEQGTPESAWTLAMLVSSEDPGLAIFPTHRVFARRPDGDATLEAEVAASHESAEAALAALGEVDRDRPAAVRLTADTAEVIVGAPGQLDVEMLDPLGHDGISYTPRAEEAAGTVTTGEAEVAYLLRPLRVEDVFTVARRGVVMPQKSTYFYPKLISGLVLHPL